MEYSGKNGEFLLTHNLAKEIELSHNSMIRMENDYSYNPGVLTLLKVSTFFNVSIESLIIKD